MSTAAAPNPSAKPTSLGALYEWAYSGVAGHPPVVRPWHHQWLASLYIRRDLQQVLGNCRGRLLDVGCGSKPYARFAPQVDAYIGIDVAPGPTVDHVIVPREQWPLADGEFDTVLCTQVLEHVVDLEHVLHESRRVLRQGGGLICTVPFLYNEHGAPYDFRRFSARASSVFQEAGFEVVEVRRQGAVGSTMVVLLQNWLEVTLNAGFIRRIVKGALLPLWLLWSLALNLVGRAWDAVDHTGLFYSNVMFVLLRR